MHSGGFDSLSRNLPHHRVLEDNNLYARHWDDLCGAHLGTDAVAAPAGCRWGRAKISV